MTNKITIPKEIDTSYIEPFLKEVSTGDIKNKVKNTLGLTKEGYKKELINRIETFIENLYTDIKNNDYNSNYKGYLNLIENYTIELELLGVITKEYRDNINDLKEKFNKFKKSKKYPLENNEKKQIDWKDN